MVKSSLLRNKHAYWQFSRPSGAKGVRMSLYFSGQVVAPPWRLSLVLGAGRTFVMAAEVERAGRQDEARGVGGVEKIEVRARRTGARRGARGVGVTERVGLEGRCTGGRRFRRQLR